MKDRNVQHASRFRLTKVPGTDDVYDLIPAPGEVYEEGTLINKSALLKDATAALFGLDENAVPDDVLALIKQMIDSKAKFATGSYVGNGTSGYSNQNSLEFGMYANLVFIFADNSSNDSRDFALFIRGASYGIRAGAIGLTGEKTASISLYSIPTFTETGVSWYSDNNPVTQLNTNGTTYNYLAI